ncbi:putative secreted protein (Por secretion system target) [Tenacibaculum caenipelagi]|uniref:Putative secreted protein (Por secretion system target) n=1 Tax=Tenacibaculum caenipelagi TaxID=1325435 RepID=A0A4V6PW75_9FLAO|nr:putative secreted protein (Por secretion system target) [Tenacibaculum caenipelagi]
MRLFFLFFCGVFFTFKAYSQVDFPLNVKKIEPKKLEKKILKKKYYLISKKDLILNKKSINIIRKLDDNFFIVTKKEEVNGFTFKGDLFDINNNWKLSNRSTELSKKKNKRVKIVVKTINSKSFLKEVAGKNLNIKILHRYKDLLTLEVSSNEIVKIASLYQSIYIDTQLTPKPEAISIEKVDLSVNNVYDVHNDYNTINGEGITVSVKELLFDVEDIDLRNRIKLYGNESESTSSHATLMATTIGGAGNSTYDSKGVAYHGYLSSSDFSTLLPDNDAYYIDNDIFIQNHSYGTEIENFYGVEANAYDQSTIDIPELLHVFSSGNTGEATSTEGNYKGIVGYANMTGNFKMAKNILVVGGVNEELVINSRSSKGPTYDGRIKPELVAHGPEGTSDAAAVVSGVAALLQQKYKESTNTFPPSSLVKSLLIAGADDVGVKGIDFKSGYGNVDASQSMKVLDDGSYINDVISSNEVKEYLIPINATTQEVRIALVWNDVPANVYDNIALVNDLDLEMSKDSNTWFPWVLDATPSLDSLEKEAVQGEDHINNVELITIDNPEEGTYKLKVKANSLATYSQSFSISYFIQPKNVFTWNYPTKNDQLPTKTDKYIRWTNNLGNPISKIEYSINNGGWVEVVNSTNVSSPFLLWNTPETNGVVQLRALINGVYYASDEFVVSDIITPTIDYNCDENIQFSWEAVSNAIAYDVQLLEETHMHTNTTLNETSVVIPKNTFKTPYISITPVFDVEKGVKGQTINYDLQSIYCYYKSFLAFIKDENVVDIRLSLSTLKNVASVVFEKTLNGDTEIIKTFTNPNTQELQVDDSGVLGGENEYRARIILNDGSEIYTDVIDISFPFDNTLKIYPNPVTASEGMFLYSRGNDLDIEIVDVTGRVIYTNKLQKIRQTIPIPNFKTGLLFVRLLKEGRQIAVKKILVKP